MRLDDLAAQFAATDDGGPFAIALHREWADPEVTAYFTVPGDPRSKARARVARRGNKMVTYTPAETVQAEAAVAAAFRSAAGSGPDSTATFGVFAVFFCATRQRRDVDNMLKLVLDGLNKIAWADDSQVTEVSGRLVRDVGRESARTEVIVYETVSAMSGGLMATQPCAWCTEPIRVFPSTRGRTYCSQKCAGEAKRSRPLVTCETCRVGFPGSSGRRFCSRECSYVASTETVECPCGISFLAHKAFGRKFCSVECGTRYKRRRQPASRPARLTAGSDYEAPLRGARPDDKESSDE